MWWGVAAAVAGVGLVGLGAAYMLHTDKITTESNVRFQTEHLSTGHTTVIFVGWSERKKYYNGQTATYIVSLGASIRCRSQPSHINQDIKGQPPTTHARRGLVISLIFFSLSLASTVSGVTLPVRALKCNHASANGRWRQCPLAVIYSGRSRQKRDTSVLCGL
jgi:hypothetical protein